MRPPLTVFGVEIPLFLWTLVSLTSALASAAPSEENTHVAVSPRSDSSSSIVVDADLSDIAPESGDDSPLQSLTIDIHTPGVAVHEYARHHVQNTIRHESLEPAHLFSRYTSSSFPTAFDTSLSTNFTSSTCPDFFTQFLSDSSYTNCHAISMLLRNSNAFFHTLSSAAATSHILDIACASNVTDCTAIMSDLASRLLSDENCGQDYAAGNPLVTDAYINMIVYQPIYRASCLQNPDTSDYCFVDAVTNSSNPANYDIYSLPYGSTITSTPFPTCNVCLQASLDIFSDWAQIDGQPLTTSYLPSAKAINNHCGSGFANVNITVGSEETSSASQVGNGPSLVIITVSLGLSLGGLNLMGF